jgi:hypothetical protein
LDEFSKEFVSKATHNYSVEKADFEKLIHSLFAPAPPDLPTYEYHIESEEEKKEVVLIS